MVIAQLLPTWLGVTLIVMAGIVLVLAVVMLVLAIWDVVSEWWWSR